ncbi:MAG: hypothetical protein HDT38_07475 [Clostridiales bacterium]|nr:hypothetical protein [Clostridiales bacterium]
MNQILNPSVTALAEAICAQQRENGFVIPAIDSTLRYAKHLSSFIDAAHYATYLCNAYVGSWSSDDGNQKFSLACFSNNN